MRHEDAEFLKCPLIEEKVYTFPRRESSRIVYLPYPLASPTEEGLLAFFGKLLVFFLVCFQRSVLL